MEVIEERRTGKNDESKIFSNEVWDVMGSIKEGESYPVGEIRMGK